VHIDPACAPLGFERPSIIACAFERDPCKTIVGAQILRHNAYVLYTSIYAIRKTMNWGEYYDDLRDRVTVQPSRDDLFVSGE
jgi:hypothetical protein